MRLNPKLYKTVTIIISVTVLVLSAIIMLRQQGLVEGYDFGAGAYYYADIPGYEKIINDDAFKTSIPVWVHVILFLIWGWMMYRLWVWIDKKN